MLTLTDGAAVSDPFYVQHAVLDGWSDQPEVVLPRRLSPLTLERLTSVRRPPRPPRLGAQLTPRERIHGHGERMHGHRLTGSACTA